MKILRATTVALAWFMVLVVMALAFTTRADETDKKTIFTFSEPVELPGVTLPAGTYVFKVLDSMSDRNIVQVFDKDETHLYATFLTIPDYRRQPSDKPIVRFSETAAGGPPAIKARPHRSGCHCSTVEYASSGIPSSSITGMTGLINQRWVVFSVCLFLLAARNIWKILAQPRRVSRLPKAPRQRLRP